MKTTLLKLDKAGRLFAVILAVKAFLVTDPVYGQTAYQWKGAVSTAWSNSGNWSSAGIPPTGQIDFARLNVTNNPGGNACTYTVAQGATVFSNGVSSGRSLVIASSSGSTVSGDMVISGGIWQSGGAVEDVIGNGSFSGTTYYTNSASLTIAGGSYIFTNYGAETMYLPLNLANAVLNVNSGYMAVATLKIGRDSGTTYDLNGTINLNGGTLCVGSIAQYAVTNAFSTNNFNGGTLQAFASGTILAGSITAANVLSGGAIIDSQGYNVICAAPLINGTGGLDGGLTKLGSGTVTLSQPATYTGPTSVQNGTLALTLPMATSSLILSTNATVSVTVSNTSWSIPLVSATNATFSLSYGNINGTPVPALAVNSLNVTGTNTVVVSGIGFPLGVTHLITCLSRAGGGVFVLGTLPQGLQATLADNGTSVDLNVTLSVQGLTWSGASSGQWDTNGTLDWNSGNAQYQEYGASGNRYGDVVTFDDSSSVSSVTVASILHPTSVLVNVNAAFYYFTGLGSISGPTSLIKSGTSILTVNNTNWYTGGTLIGTTGSGGTLQVNNDNALGAGTVTVGQTGGSQSTLEIANGSAVTNQVILNGPGVGGALGSLRGADFNPNLCSGNVIIASSGTRIGTEVGANLTVSGNITEASTNTLIWLRPGAGGTLMISGTGNHWSGGTETFGGSGSQIILGANNAIATNGLLSHSSCAIDLNGYNQTFAGIVLNGGTLPPSAAQIYNNGPNSSVLTLAPAATASFPGSLQDGNSPLALVMTGSSIQILTGANTYSGGTTINGGELIISNTNSTSGTGSGVVTVNNGGTLGGSGTISGPVTSSPGATMAPGTPSLIGTLSVNNTVNLAGTTVIKLNGAGTTNNDVLAATTINLGGTLVLTNAGGGLTNTSLTFTLFTGALHGTFSSVLLPTLAPGLSWNTANLQTAGTVNIVGSVQRPVISPAVTTAGTNIAFSITGGVPNGTFYLLTSTNLAVPLGLWPVAATNTYDNNGNFSITNAINSQNAQQFFSIVQ